MNKRVGQGRGGSKPCPRSLLIEKICRDCAKNLDPPCTLKEFAEKYSPKELMEIAASELKKNNLSFTIAEFSNSKRRLLSLDEDVGSSGGSGIPKDGDLRGTQLATLTRTSGGLSLAGGTMPLMPNALMGYVNPNFMPNANLMGNGNPNLMGVNGWGGMGPVPPHQAVALYQQGGMMAQHPNNASHPTPQHTVD